MPQFVSLMIGLRFSVSTKEYIIIIYRFRKEPKMIYFTSDLHFDHARAIQLCLRPFTTVEQMNQAIIDNWNKTVTSKDEVYILGDITLSHNAEKAQNYLLQLNGIKHLVKGNHDQFVNSIHFKPNIFASVQDYKEFKYQGWNFALMHYPILDWNHMYGGKGFMLHGHSHNKPEYNEKNIHEGLKRFDVGVDANNFTPISIEEIIKKFTKK